MAMIRKMAPGSAEDMKYIKSVKNAPKSAKGGTQRTSFTGSSDSRSSGAPNAAVMGGMKTSPGYADQAPIMADMNSAAGSMASGHVSGGPTASGINKKFSTASESVTGGMGGTVYKDMK
jgi:hypothetical protein|tara:strand:- start:5500 stop:5856 length:357 start_codon:yes stop_codon:yes gene_type:complete